VVRHAGARRNGKLASASKAQADVASSWWLRPRPVDVEVGKDREVMARRAGSADLPLHGGHVPKWLADRMTRLGAVMTQAIVHGRDEFLRRLANPFWFQSFGAGPAATKERSK
jgi:hypothetical protein